MRLTILTFLFMLGTVSAMANDSTKQKQALPSVQVKTLDGKSVDIKDYAVKGKLTIISFWATWCGPCIKELDNILDVYDEWQKKYNCEVVAVTIDDSRNIPKVKPFVDGKGWPFTILTDENKDLARALNVNNPPQVFLVDQEGNIVYTHVGYTEGSEFDLEAEMKKLITP
ncbi:MAG: TlpA disulfide reductase family protein [Bacteroidota bacterium]